MNPSFEYLPVAVRAWPDRRKTAKAQNTPGLFPHKLLVIDTETTTDPSQSLLFGSAQLVWVAFGGGDRLKVFSEPKIDSEVIFYADDLPERNPSGFDVLCRYCEDNRLDLLSQAEFAERFILTQLPVSNGKPRQGEATLTFFNSPFDISRLAYRYGNSRSKNKGGFTFYMFQDGASTQRDIVVKHIDSKKQLTSPAILDLRTLVWAMTNKSHSLASACTTFELPEEYCKGHTEEHGTITPDYISYNRQDVTATAYLACQVLREYHKHPIPLSPVNALSPASIGKSYLDAMGITPVLDRPDVPRDPVLMGNIASSFYGGRSECNIRNTPVPVMLLDFQSMYSTVNALMNLWDFITAASIEAVEATADVQDFLDGLTLGTILDKSIWPELTCFAEIRPDGDILPVRAAYSADDKNVTNVGDNQKVSPDSFWYALPDLVSSKIRTGRTPVVLRAVRFVPRGKLAGLTPVDLMGSIRVDPAREDFFRYVIEQRQTIKAERQGIHPAACLCLSCRIIEQLKVTSNATSYGIYVEMLREDTDTPVTQNIYGLAGQPWQHTGTALETAQRWCYPPIGSLITSAARLMLGILEALITELGGTGAFRDTDSTAVVATETGGLIPCPGGPYELDGNPAIRAVSRAEVESVRSRLNALNPYGGPAGKEILKTEAVCWAYVISAKRYCLFEYDESGRPVVPSEIDGKRAYMEHGLGMYLNPADIESDDRDWMRELWQYIVSAAHGLDVPLPGWIDRPALTRSAVTSPHLMRSFREWNDGRSYGSQVKPFGFMLLCSEWDRSRLARGFPPRRFVAPYSRDPADWVRFGWHDLQEPDGRGLILGEDFQVKTFRDVLREYADHPEPEFLGPDGKPCGPRTSGLLSRRTVRVTTISHIGKESNRLEDAQYGLLSDWDETLTTYGGPARMTPARQLLGKVPASWTADQVNKLSDSIRRKIADGQSNICEFYGRPVKVDSHVIGGWLNGGKVTPDIERFLNRVAAYVVFRVVGIKEHEIAWEGTSIGRLRYTPESVLALWRDLGYPSPRSGMTLSVRETIERPAVVEIRTCGWVKCSNPVARSNKMYCSEKCKKAAEKQRSRTRKIAA